LESEFCSFSKLAIVNEKRGCLKKVVSFFCHFLENIHCQSIENQYI
jgi:hypothetical protein